MFNGLLVADTFNGMALVIIILVLVVMTLLSFLLLLVKQYKRCPSNRILVIYGKIPSGLSAVTVHGGAKFVMPLIQDYNWLSLEPIRVNVPSPHRPPDKTLDFPVPQFFTVAIGTTPPLMLNAAIRLLGLSLKEIEQFVDDIIVAQLTKLIDTMVADSACDDREAFYARLDTMLEEELAQLGMVLVSYRRE